MTMQKANVFCKNEVSVIGLTERKAFFVEEGMYLRMRRPKNRNATLSKKDPVRNDTDAVLIRSEILELNTKNKEYLGDEEDIEDDEVEEDNPNKVVIDEEYYNQISAPPQEDIQELDQQQSILKNDAQPTN